MSSAAPTHVWLLGALAAGVTLTPADADDAAHELFENRIRPVLAEQCYSCHNSADTAEGGLAVDHRAALREGGDGGPAVVPGKPEESRLLAAMRHELAGLEMPQDGPKLSDAVLADFRRWIAEGAFDPRDAAPDATELAGATSWDAVFERRLQWWSFQPIRKPELPPGTAERPIDRFVQAKQREHGLEPSPSADRRTLLRRLSFALTGLPPTPEEVEAFVADDRPDAYERQVDRLLDTTAFAERWARHWMDWARYAESHGSEGDPAIPDAWRYRDYLIRALQADVPFDRLVREHVAGDLLEEPRVDRERGVVESMIAPAHWRMVFHGFSPTDALDEKVRFTDDQINAFSKAFLGLTVSCARCHDHKFDPVSQEDYYALFGILASCRPGRNLIDTPELLQRNAAELAGLKPAIQSALAADWQQALQDLPTRLLAEDGPTKSAKQPRFVLHDWKALRERLAKGETFASAWSATVSAWREQQRQLAAYRQGDRVQHWDFGVEEEANAWFAAGNGLTEPLASSAGEFAVAPSGDAALLGIYPSGVYSHRLSTKHAGRFTSPRIDLDQDYDVYLRVIGDAGSARFVAQHYPRRGQVFPVRPLEADWRLLKFDLDYWTGDAIHLEVACGLDAPLLIRDVPRSWLGIREAVLVRKDEPGPPADPREFVAPLLAAAEAESPTSLETAARLYADVLREAVGAWQANRASDAKADLLGRALTQGLLPNRLGDLPTAAPAIERYRRLESDVPVPRRIVGVEETVGRDQPLFVRGNHKQPADPVPRRFLSAVDPTPYETPLSGRRRLAEDVLREDNPLTRRVLVNRLWHHLFGRGIVATPDNLGRLGAEPTHPELLDWLAVQFSEDGWSLKRMIRRIVLSETWQQSSKPSSAASRIDPDNLWLSHFSVRRLEAEAIRDNLLATSGELDGTPFGPPVGGTTPRRSIYVRVRRNSLDPFLRAFDFPEPFSATGRRDATNVPAQSLTLMNDPQVAGYAAAWARRVLADRSLETDAERIDAMFRTALARPATPTELDQARRYLESVHRSATDLVAQADQLRREIATAEQRAAGIFGPARERLLADKRAAADQAGDQFAALVDPVGRWEFDGDLRDAIGTAHGTLRGDARLENGVLVVSGQGYVTTTPLPFDLEAKTLEAWVSVADLDQSGGGVLSVQTPDGRVFDAIVYAEREPRQWLAGSNNGRRTSSFGGPREAEAREELVHIALVYHADGTITGYRNGHPYGAAYASNGPQPFAAGETVLTFGLRHLPGVGNRFLRGRIERAQLYDRALTPEQVAASAAAGGTVTVSADEVLTSLSPSDRAAWQAAKAEAARRKAELAALGPVPERVDEELAWSDLARAIFCFKEFVYLR